MILSEFTVFSAMAVHAINYLVFYRLSLKVDNQELEMEIHSATKEAMEEEKEAAEAGMESVASIEGTSGTSYSSGSLEDGASPPVVKSTVGAPATQHVAEEPKKKKKGLLPFDIPLPFFNSKEEKVIGQDLSIPNVRRWLAIQALKYRRYSLTRRIDLSAVISIIIAYAISAGVILRK
jgi:hypothetical protein